MRRLLMIPLVGFLPATDERVASTIRLIEKELMFDGYVARYHPDESGNVDGLPPGEGAFLPCSFWLVDCLHLMGREDEARTMFERLLSISTSLGLMAEEYETKRGRLIGEFSSGLHARRPDQYGAQSLPQGRSGRASRRQCPRHGIRPRHSMSTPLVNPFPGDVGPMPTPEGILYRVWAFCHKKVVAHIEKPGWRYLHARARSGSGWLFLRPRSARGEGRSLSVLPG